MVKFRLGAVPVSVHASFLLLALFGWLRYETFEGTLAWTLAVFLAILVHEAGHAFTARGFGAQQVSIMLFAFGGATTYPVTTDTTPWRRFLISAAGSFVGIVTGAGLIFVGIQQGWWEFRWELPPLTASRPPDFLLVFVLSYITAALVWGILNWLPILPLDGGQMLESFLEIVAPSIAETGSRVVSLVVGVPVIAWAVVNQEIFVAMIVGFLLVSGLRRPRKAGRPPPRRSAEDGVVQPEVLEDPAAPSPSDRPREAQSEPPEFPI